MKLSADYCKILNSIRILMIMGIEGQMPRGMLLLKVGRFYMCITKYTILEVRFLDY